MKRLFDQNLSPKLSVQLADIFPDSTHVHLVRFDREADPRIWEFAQANGFIIVSKDTDFADYSAAFWLSAASHTRANWQLQDIRRGITAAR